MFCPNGLSVRDELAVKSKVHPKYRREYRVGRWAAYEGGLVRRGDITVGLSSVAVADWDAQGGGRPGSQRKFSVLTLCLSFHLPLRQAEGS